MIPKTFYITISNISFSNAGFVPMILTVGVSPVGTHSVTIVTSDGRDDTISYTITDIESDGKHLSLFFSQMQND